MQVTADVVSGQYYPFIYGGRVRENEIPSFCFHGVQSRYFEDILGYLRDNNYTNITAEDYFRIRRGEMRKPDNPVMLSFDDGTGSVWSVVYPLLEKYGYRATVFLVPGRISESRDRLPSLKDVWDGNATLEDVDSRDSSDAPFLSWDEVRHIHEAGTVDFQSHGLEHRQVFIGSGIIDFVRPEIVRKYSGFQFSMFDELDLRRPDKAVLKPGSPIYQSAPRLSDHPRYYEDRQLKQACIDYVEDAGGSDFFLRRDWRGELDRLVKQFRTSHEPAGRFESPAEQRQEIYRELSASREAIERNLPGKVVRHFCYPWGVCGKLSQGLLEEAGYVTAYTGRIGRNARLTLDQDPKILNRIGPDFFFLLPGSRRDSLSRVLKRKLMRRLRRGTHHLSY